MYNIFPVWDRFEVNVFTWFCNEFSTLIRSFLNIPLILLISDNKYLFDPEIVIVLIGLLVRTETPSSPTKIPLPVIPFNANAGPVAPVGPCSPPLKV